MFQIQWKLYSESEILEVLTEVFNGKGYEVYNIHKTDRRGEKGIDIECNKTAENQKVIIAVKKNPKKRDISQLQDFIKRTSTSKIYVYIEEPTTDFKNAMEEVKNRVSFWNAESLTREVFCTDSRFYLFLILENSFMRPIYRIVYSFFKVYFRVEKQESIEKPSQANTEMLNLLWAAKDRSASLHKSLRTLQNMFEHMNTGEVSEQTKEAMVSAFLLSIDNLKFENLNQLESLFSEFLEKYPTNFEQFCKQTKGRSNWTLWGTCLPTLSPGSITKSLESARESSKRWQELFKKRKVPEIEPESTSELLGDVARILANEVDMFEDAVDDLFSIGVFGKWDDMREQFGRMSKERSDELKSALKNELNGIHRKIDQALTDGSFQNQSFISEIFSSHIAELKQHLSMNDFLFLRNTYSKIKALRSPSHLASVNKRRYEEVKDLIVKTLQLLDKKDLWDDISAYEQS
ncbi:MAG TPA: restriction endonuclease [Acidobacteriota bacterium]|nr:restriction endonuclease [Acidobacteriota bacterium]